MKSLRIKAFVAALALIFVLPFQIFAAVPGGECGDGVYWSFDNGLLTVSGNGEMDDFHSDDRPWDYLAGEIEGVVIGDGVTYIGSYAFCELGGEDLSLTLGNGITEIGEGAFAYNLFKGGLVLPDSAEVVGYGAFLDAGFDGALVLGNSLTEICGTAFYCCGFNGELVIPDSVETIGEGAFAGCYALESLTIGENENLTELPYKAFEGCFGLEGELIIPGNITDIGDYAFEYCSGISSIGFGEGVETIGDGAFGDCASLEGRIELPAALTSVGNMAFSGCGKLCYLTLEGNKPQFGAGVFFGCRGVEVYYPDENTSWQQALGDGFTIGGAKILPYSSCRDLNGDGYENASDAVYLLWSCCGKEGFAVGEEFNCDYNGDGESNSADAAYLLWSLYYPDEYPINNIR